jgi:hypothetical protein
MRGVILGLIVTVPSMAAGQEPGPSAKEQYEALAAQYKAAMDTWERQFDAFGDRNAPEAPKEARYRDWPGWIFAPQFVQVAEFHPKEPAAMDALLKVVDEIGRSVGTSDILLLPHYTRALQLLLRDHLDDDRLKEFCRCAARYSSPEGEAFLRAVLEKSRNREVRGAACLGLARNLTTRAEIAEKPWFDDKDRMKDPFARFIVSRHDPAYFRYIRESKPREANAEALKLYERAVKDYGDVIYWQDPAHPERRRSVGELTRPELIRLRAKVGEPAPKEGETKGAKPPSG